MERCRPRWSRPSRCGTYGPIVATTTLIAACLPHIGRWALKSHRTWIEAGHDKYVEPPSHWYVCWSVGVGNYSIVKLKGYRLSLRATSLCLASLAICGSCDPVLLEHDSQQLKPAGMLHISSTCLLGTISQCQHKNSAC